MIPKLCIVCNSSPRHRSTSYCQACISEKNKNYKKTSKTYKSSYKKYNDSKKGKDRVRAYRASIKGIEAAIRAKDRVREKNTGVSAEQYRVAKILQGFQCAICGIEEDRLTKALSADHCHKTGKFRGLLCMQCNSALGNFKDSLEILDNTKKYLLLHSNVDMESVNGKYEVVIKEQKQD